MPFAPIFVVGVGRSGTSLVQSMLAAHSQLAFPPETQFVRRYVGRGRLARRYRGGGVPAVRAALQDDDRIGRLGLDLDRVLARYTRGAPFSETDLYETLLTEFAKMRRKPRVGDKDPRCVEYLPLLVRHWPAAHVVHVIRDPRDVLASRKKAAWSRHRSSIAHMFVNRVQLRAGVGSGPRLYGPRYHEVVYEMLLAEPEATLRRLTERLGMAYEEDMLDFSDAARTLVSTGELAWKRETLGPLLTANAGKWRRELANWESVLAAAICREGVTRVARARQRDTSAPPARRLRVVLLSWILRAIEWPYVSYRWLRLARLARGNAS